MAWPSESGSLGLVAAARRQDGSGRARRSLGEGGSQVIALPAGRGRFYAEHRGVYRVFGEACYRLYRHAMRPPEATDAPFATSETLPATPADTFADGTWYLAASYFNGVLDSGFLPIGPAGETYLRLDVAAGIGTTSPPAGPLDVRLEARADGIVRVTAVAVLEASDPAEEWALAYTVNGTDPTAGAPTVTAAMSGRLAVWTYDLPAQPDGTEVRVRVQTRRNDGTVLAPVWTYSEGSTVVTVDVDAAGPSVPRGGEWEPVRL